MKISIGSKIGLGYACAFILLLVIGVTAYQNVTHGIENAALVTRSHSAIIELNHVTIRMENAE